MSDERVNDKPNNEEGEHSASAIFVELMRQAAAKAAFKPTPAATEPNADVAAKQPKAASDGDARERSLEPAEEAHEIRRVRPRLVLRRPQPGSMAGGFFGTLSVVILSTALVATLLMFFVNPEFLNPAVVQGIAARARRDHRWHGGGPANPRCRRRSGFVVLASFPGHRGRGQRLDYDPGAVCYDEYKRVVLTEESINYAVATRVVNNLEALNFTVDMLDEFDPRLVDYRADALVSIHANSCIDFGELVTGFHRLQVGCATRIPATMSSCANASP